MSGEGRDVPPRLRAIAGAGGRASGPGRVRVEIPAGELVDRIVALEIEAARAATPDRRARAAGELGRLAAARDAALPACEELDALTEALREVQDDQRALEADLRACEAAGAFGPEFVALARSLAPLQDRRAELREEIDRLCGA